MDYSQENGHDFRSTVCKQERLVVHQYRLPRTNLIVGLGTLLATGGSAVVAKKMRNGNTEEPRSNFTLIVVAGAVIGLLFIAAGII